MKASAEARRFYVYMLMDPRHGVPFYVGKGKGRRAWDHERDAVSGRVCNQRKHDRIIDILRTGMRPSVHIVAEYAVEAAAFAHEEELIASLPDLTNIMAGGGGRTLTSEEAKRRLAKRVYEQRIGKLSSWLAKVDTWHGVTFPNLPDGNRLADEFVALVRRLAVARPDIIFEDIRI